MYEVAAKTFKASRQFLRNGCIGEFSGEVLIFERRVVLVVSAVGQL
jgi:hypothetical protein